ncbi:hypothetical protein [Streptomyces capillispiralis]|uniref:Peptidoglycan binding protein n=1 Tax=Streptomyces capillispiralis TaxID=68182 RepID=A0A561TE83_9ACTN|nr:hypothetical protein [Streptomyces capillispiralis]TWF85416.1 hypothetical protein FHX78_112368 [Streptomyces capillispiralis]GHH90174.1 hypothetical protein GCM10017779_06310 [Streptomyces capillispiralis]
MSRETDTPSSGPNGHGGAAYPSGTPPYGIPAIPDEGTGAGRPAARPEERKTETTLTTRIRINIPGSRPIPPVVVRKPVTDAEAKDTTEAESAAPSPADTAEPPAQSARPAGASRPDQPSSPDKPASDWFAPRKSGPGKGGPAAGPANGTGAPSGSTPGTGGTTPNGTAPNAAAPAPGTGAPGTGTPGGARQGAGRPGGVVGSMSAPAGSRPGGPTGATGATGGPVAPGHGGGTGSFDVTEALAGGPAATGSRPGTGHGGGPRRHDLPYLPEETPGGRAPDGVPGQGGHPGPGAQSHPGGPQSPAGPTGGPVTGDGPMAPPTASGPTAPAGEQNRLGIPGGGLSDDTAILTPQKPAEPGTPGYGPRHDNVSGHTVTSGIPVVPPGASFNAGGAPGDGPLPHTPPKLPDPVSPPPANSSRPPKKKGRNKLVLLCGCLVFLGGVAYGAGLLMNHSDVPKGTTVLGVEIGGGTRDEAVKKLDAALDDRVNKPLKLSVDGRTVDLEPDNAGLQVDTDATVAAAARSDYNPVSVIGSLLGNHRVVDPVLPVDEEKLQAALEDAAGGAGSMTEGTITFESGKAVPVYGKPGKGIDVTKSTEAVREAYRTQVETGTAGPVNVPTTSREPKVSKAEVDRMMKEFAEPAMSAIVTVQTDAAHSIPMSPQKSLWKFLGVEAVNGKLVDKPDLNALEELYGQTFDGVLITRGNGKKTPVTPQDVYVALRQALTSKTDRVAVIETNPS